MCSRSSLLADANMASTGNGSFPGLTAPELGPALQYHMLPGLAVDDLGRLSCVCSAMRLLVASCSVSLWTRLVSRELPPLHPSLDGAGLAAVQQALSVYRSAIHNIRSARQEPLMHNKLRIVGSVVLSPDSASLATYDVDMIEYILRLPYIVGQPGFFLRRDYIDSSSVLAIKQDVLGRPTWSRDSQRLFSVHHESGCFNISAYNTATGELVSCHRVPGQQFWVGRKEWQPLSPDGRYLHLPCLSRSGSEVQVVDVHTGRSVPGVPRLVNHGCRVLWNPVHPWAAAVVAAGVGWVSSATSGVVCNKVIDVAAGRTLWTGPTGHKRRTGQPAAWSPDGRLLHLAYPGCAVGSLYPAQCQILDIITGIVALQVHSVGGTDRLPSLYGEDCNASFSPDSTRWGPVGQSDCDFMVQL